MENVVYRAMRDNAVLASSALQTARGPADTGEWSPIGFTPEEHRTGKDLWDMNVG